MSRPQPPPRAIPWRVRLVVAGALLVGRLLVWLASRLPYHQALAVGSWITHRFEPLTRARRQRNLRLFFGPDSPETDLQRIDAAHQQYLARMRTEVARAFRLPTANLLAQVRLQGEEHLQAVLARRRGALLVSGHTGTWWLIPACLAAKGYRVTAIFTAIAFPAIERQLLQLTNRFGVPLAFVGRSAYKAALRALANNEILYLSFDMAVRPKRNDLLPFGAGQLPIDPGPAQLALRQGLPVLQAACHHLQPAGHLVQCYPPEPVPPETTPAELSARWLQRLSAEVKARPEQLWSWGYASLQPAPDTTTNF